MPLYCTEILGSCSLTTITFIENKIVTTDSNGVIKYFEILKNRLVAKSHVDLEVIVADESTKGFNFSANILSVHCFRIQDRLDPNLK